VAFDAGGNPYVAHFGNGAAASAIIKIDANGSQSVFASGGNLNTPIGLAFDASRNLYVADFGSNAIVKMDANGNQSVFASGGNLNTPTGLAFDAGGNLYVANTGGQSIVKLDANGNQTVFSSGNNFTAPEFLAFTRAHHAVDIANAGSNTVSVIDTITGPPKVIATVGVGANPVNAAIF
jgi:YVTN family beta-propeller protein